MIVAGFGFRKSATLDSLKDALAQTGWSRKIDCISAPEDKAATEMFKQFAADLNATIYACSTDEVKGQDTEFMSEMSLYHRNSGSVSQAAALIAAGGNADLLTGRFVSMDRLATCALATGSGKGIMK